MARPIHTALTRASTFATTTTTSGSGPEKALARAREALIESQTQLATGKRIQRPSDDPTGFAQARAFERQQDQLERHQRVIGEAKLWTDQTELALSSLGDLFLEASEVAIRASNGILDADQLAGQIDAIRDEAIVRLRTKSNGEYLFSGTETSTAPVDESGGAVVGDFSGLRRREISPGHTITINVTDALTIDGVPALDRLQALADAVRSGNRTAVRAEMDGIQAGVDHYSRLQGQMGNVVRQLDAARAANDSQHTIIGDRRAGIEEIDLAATLAEVQRRQTALEAALRATSSSIQPSLLDYLQ